MSTPEEIVKICRIVEAVQQIEIEEAKRFHMFGNPLSKEPIEQKVTFKGDLLKGIPEETYTITKVSKHPFFNQIEKAEAKP